MSTYSSDETLTQSELDRSVTLVEIGGRSVSEQSLRKMLPNVETALFFARALKLSASDVGSLLRLLFHTNLVEVLTDQSAHHSSDLQGYLVELAGAAQLGLGVGSFDATTVPPDERLLVQLFDEMTVDLAPALENVASKIGNVLDSFPSVYGEMAFQHMRQLNRQYHNLGVSAGTFQAVIEHRQVPKRLVILDVSGSMSRTTIQALAQPVVAMAYATKSSLAIVSNTCTYWEPGGYGVEDVLREAEYGGTHYEELESLLQHNWESVITVADYDSSMSAKEFLKNNVQGRIGTVYDISLVNRPTFLAQCVGQFARKVVPLLVAAPGTHLTW